jgi:squalene-associated FAD-dependent desaturase
LGGRARGITVDGYRIDNGQHLFMGANHSLAQLLRTVGVKPKQLLTQRLQLEVPGAFRLKAAPLPAPFHLISALILARGLSLVERWQIAQLLRQLQRKPPQATQTVGELLQQQSPRLLQRFWAPLVVAALNTPYQTASAALFARVLNDTLAADAHASELWLSRQDLSELFPVPAVRYLSMRRGIVRTSTTIVSAARDQQGYWLDGDPRFTSYSHLVIATAPYHANQLLASFPSTERTQQQINRLSYQPIATLWLDYGPTVRLPAPMLGLCHGGTSRYDGPGQWVFDRGQITNQPGLLAVVISATEPQPNRPELIAAIQRQLEQALGPLPSPRWQRLIIERRATFASTPDRPRISSETAEPGLWLAGDYLIPYYPATVETAVRSGIAVAQRIVATS